MKDIINFYATQGGKISEFGTIRVLRNCVVETGDPNAGLEIWGPVLYEHRNNNSRAIVEEGHLIILNKAGKKIAVNTAANLFSVYSKFECEVTEHGWVLPHPPGKIMLKAFAQIEKGETTTVRNDSIFAKVSSKFTGLHVTCLRGGNSFMKIFAKDRTVIDCEVSSPLSYKR